MFMRNGSVSKEYAASLSAEKAIYDALIDDGDFLKKTEELYAKGDTERLSGMLKTIIGYEANRQFSDMLIEQYPNREIDNGSASKNAISLSAALAMCDSGDIDLVSSYRTAASTLKLMTGLYAELMRKDKAHEKSKC